MKVYLFKGNAYIRLPQDTVASTPGDCCSCPHCNGAAPLRDVLNVTCPKSPFAVHWPDLEDSGATVRNAYASEHEAYYKKWYHEQKGDKKMTDEFIPAPPIGPTVEEVRSKLLAKLDADYTNLRNFVCKPGWKDAEHPTYVKAVERITVLLNSILKLNQAQAEAST